jgi:hypothetical protein
MANAAAGGLGFGAGELTFHIMLPHIFFVHSYKPAYLSVWQVRQSAAPLFVLYFNELYDEFLVIWNVAMY